MSNDYKESLIEGDVEVKVVLYGVGKSSIWVECRNANQSIVLMASLCYYLEINFSFTCNDICLIETDDMSSDSLSLYPEVCLKSKFILVFSDHRKNHYIAASKVNVLDMKEVGEVNYAANLKEYSEILKTENSEVVNFLL